MKDIFKKRMVFLSSLWLLVTHIFYVPSGAYAIAVADGVKCDELPNEYWTPRVAKAYARALMDIQYDWNSSEYKALNKLWTAESNWRVDAFNKSADKNTGKNAGGIPQILGLNPNSPAPYQIERGLAYISDRYGRPSIAWQHHREHGWY
jgi:hypothetical protein